MSWVHVIQRALYRSTSGTIDPDSLPDYLYHSTVFPKHSDAATLNDYMRSAERYLIEQTIRKVGETKPKRHRCWESTERCSTGKSKSSV